MNAKVKELLNTYGSVMTSEQKSLLKKKTIELIMMGCEIAELNIPNRWIDTFTELVYSRGWVNLDILHKDRIQAIGSIDSESVFILANDGKRAGLKILYEISVYIDDEVARGRAVTIVKEIGVKRALKELDMIIDMAKNNKYRSLFD